MVTNLVVDTSVLIDHLRQTTDNPFAETKYSAIVKSGSKCFIAGVSISELYSGTSTKIKREERRVSELISNLMVVPTTNGLYQKAGELVRDNQPLGTIDALIAASAISKKASLVTFYNRHFEHIKGLGLFN